MRGHLIAAGIWLGAMGAGYWAFEHFGRAEVVSLCGEDGQVRIPAARDGHFYLAGEVNGTAVRFLVDTGASYVTLGQADAKRAGVTGGAAAVFGTANGQVVGEVVRNQHVKAACFELPEVSVAVSPGLGETALLGQNVLRRFEVVQTRSELRLRRRPGAE